MKTLATALLFAVAVLALPAKAAADFRLRIGWVRPAPVYVVPAPYYPVPAMRPQVIYVVPAPPQPVPVPVYVQPTQRIVVPACSGGCAPCPAGR